MAAARERRGREAPLLRHHRRHPSVVVGSAATVMDYWANDELSVREARTG